ncbi:MAG: T9SS type A sorting domain-containing protein [Bacteroidia bacterium]
MKNSFFAIIFVLIGKLILASNCDVQFGFFAKNNSWKAVNSTVSNGVIYIEINTETDSFSLQLLKNINCSITQKISDVYFEEEKINLPKEGGIVKSASVGGLYKILIITPGSSEWFKLFVRVSNPTSIKNSFSNTNLLIYPNPAKENFFVENTNQVSQVKVIDIMGADVLTIENTFRKDVMDIDISKLPAGQYFVTFINDKQKMTKKLVKL